MTAAPSPTQHPKPAGNPGRLRAFRGDLLHDALEQAREGLTAALVEASGR